MTPSFSACASIIRPIRPPSAASPSSVWMPTGTGASTSSSPLMGGTTPRRCACSTRAPEPISPRAPPRPPRCPPAGCPITAPTHFRAPIIRSPPYPPRPIPTGTGTPISATTARPMRLSAGVFRLRISQPCWRKRPPPIETVSLAPVAAVSRVSRRTPWSNTSPSPRLSLDRSTAT